MEKRAMLLTLQRSPVYRGSSSILLSPIVSQILVAIPYSQNRLRGHTQVWSRFQKMRRQREAYRCDICHSNEPRATESRQSAHLFPYENKKTTMDLDFDITGEGRGERDRILSENRQERLQLGRVIRGFFRRRSSGSRHGEQANTTIQLLSRERKDQ